MKKFINNPETVVGEMIDGMILAHPHLIKKVDGKHVLVRSTPKHGKVALVSGGGSGHEPSHAGYIGEGMLDGAIAGEVFTSPTPDQIYEAIRAVDNGHGTLLIVKNYSGDVMNFEMAAELASAEGMTTAMVIVGDDVAVQEKEQRRGIAGTVLVHKIAGAAAEQGKSLYDVKRVAEKVIDNVRTMGVSLTPCTVPAVGKPGFDIGDDEMELGMGIHGEQGVKRTTLTRADQVAETLVKNILDDMPIATGSSVLVMINGLGATPNMELYILYRKIANMLSSQGIKIYDALIGEYMTSLEMAGASVTLLKLDEELQSLFEAPAHTIAWRRP